MYILFHSVYTLYTYFKGVLVMFCACSRDVLGMFLQIFQGCVSIVLAYVYNTFDTFLYTFFRNCSECIIFQNKYIGQNLNDLRSSKITVLGLKTINLEKNIKFHIKFTLGSFLPPSVAFVFAHCLNLFHVKNGRKCCKVLYYILHEKKMNSHHA